MREGREGREANKTLFLAFWFHFLAMYPSNQSVKLAANSPGRKGKGVAHTRYTDAKVNRYTAQNRSYLPRMVPMIRQMYTHTLKSQPRLSEPRNYLTTCVICTTSCCGDAVHKPRVFLSLMGAWPSNVPRLTGESQLMLRRDDKSGQEGTKNYPTHGDHVGDCPHSIGLLPSYRPNATNSTEE